MGNFNLKTTPVALTRTWLGERTYTTRSIILDRNWNLFITEGSTDLMVGRVSSFVIDKSARSRRLIV